MAPLLERLQDPTYRDDTRRRTAEAVAGVHATVHARLSCSTAGYDADVLHGVLIHSPAEVRVLLNCEED